MGTLFTDLAHRGLKTSPGEACRLGVRRPPGRARYPYHGSHVPGVFNQRCPGVRDAHFLQNTGVLCENHCTSEDWWDQGDVTNGQAHPLCASHSRVSESKERNCVSGPQGSCLGPSHLDLVACTAFISGSALSTEGHFPHWGHKKGGQRSLQLFLECSLSPS